MKYRFVWDKDFLGNQAFELSEEEKTIVIAIIVGGHNAIFSGYNTERLISAVKALHDMSTPFISIEKSIDYRELIGRYSDSGLKQGFVTDADGGFLHISDLHSHGSDVLSWLLTVMVNGWIKLSHACNTIELPAKFQLLADTQTVDTYNWSLHNIFLNCDIRYNCKRDAERNLYSVSALRKAIENVKTFQTASERIGKNSKIEGMGEIRPSSITTEKLMSEDILIDTARLGRTIADIHGHNLTFASDLSEAFHYQNLCE